MDSSPWQCDSPHNDALRATSNPNVLLEKLQFWTLRSLKHWKVAALRHGRITGLGEHDHFYPLYFVPVSNVDVIKEYSIQLRIEIDYIIFFKLASKGNSVWLTLKCLIHIPASLGNIPNPIHKRIQSFLLNSHLILYYFYTLHMLLMPYAPHCTVI